MTTDQAGTTALETLELPDISSFTDDERLLAQVTIGIVRSGGAMYNGRFIECVVATLLDADFPTVGTSPWDLVTKNGTRVEVRSGTKTFSLVGNKDVHAWVFVHKTHPTRFSVATPAQVASIGQRRISVAKLQDLVGVVDATELANALAAKVGRPSA